MRSHPPPKSSLGSLLFRYLPYLRAQRRAATVVATLALLSPLVTAALIWSFKSLLDDVLIAGRMELLAQVASIYALAACAKVTIDYATQRVEVGVVESINLALRADIYGHALSLSPGSLVGHTTGDVLTRMQRDALDAEYVVFTGPIAVLADGAAVVAYVGFLLYLSWPLALSALAALAVVAGLVWHLAERIRKASHLARRANSHWMSLAEERLDAAQIVHAFDALSRERATFRIRCGRVRTLEVVALTFQALQSALVEATIATAGLFVLGLGAVLIAKGMLTVGGLVAFIGVAHSLFAPARALAKCAGRLQHAAAGAQRVAQLLDRKSLIFEADKPLRLAPLRGRVEFSNVTFGYPDAPEILHGLSFSIEPGETVALVGPSGGGKSSLVRLLLRQYDCNRGTVLIDGVDIRRIGLASLRRAVSPVFQDAQILNGAIEANIRYGAPNATQSEINAAAKAAAVDGLSSAHGGLAMSVGPRGTRLSGGQRQRVALARALAHGGAILILDEATAGVDSPTEEVIQRALDALSGDRTLLIVAHRLSTVQRADRVIVLEEGRIVESGAPGDLLSRRSRCRQLFAAQLVNQEIAA